MKKQAHKHKLAGFTFIELLFAITLMGIMFSITLTTIVGMIRLYSFSNNITLNQQAGRSILDTVVRDIRYGEVLYPTGYAKSNSLCIKKPSDQLLIKYEAVANSVYKTTYTYNSTSSPIACEEGTGVVVKTKPTKVTPEKMYVKDQGFVFYKVQGSIPNTNQSASSIIINFNFITGNPNEQGKCQNNDIYCSQLELNTGVNISLAK